MLEPGTKMLRIMGILIFTGIGLYILRFLMASYLCFAMAGFMAFILFVLLKIEHHQDEVMFREAKKEDELRNNLKNNK
jgi:hypothetical protein